jgi:hypothetical protein
MTTHLRINHQCRIQALSNKHLLIIHMVKLHFRSQGKRQCNKVVRLVIRLSHLKKHLPSIQSYQKVTCRLRVKLITEVDMEAVVYNEEIMEDITQALLLKYLAKVTTWIIYHLKLLQTEW